MRVSTAFKRLLRVPGAGVTDVFKRLLRLPGTGVTDVFKRLLRLPGTGVTDVLFTGQGVVVTVRLRRRRRVCAECGQTGPRLQIYDHRVKRWRHLDVGANRCWIEC